MDIAFDGRALSSPAGGVRRYVGELWRAMREAEPDVHGIAVGGDPALALALGVRHQPSGWSVPTNPGWCAWALPRAAGRARADVFHAPAYTAPLWGARPLVVTLHDVSYERHPEWYPHQSDPLRRAFYRHSALRADRIITDSQFSRQEISAAYGIPAARIAVVGMDCPFPRIAEGLGGAPGCQGRKRLIAADPRSSIPHCTNRLGRAARRLASTAAKSVSSRSERASQSVASRSVPTGEWGM